MSQDRTDYKRPSQLRDDFTVKSRAERFPMTFTGRSDVEYFDQSLEEVQEHMIGHYVIVYSRSCGNATDSASTIETFVPHMSRSITISRAAKSREATPDLPIVNEVSPDIEDDNDENYYRHTLIRCNGVEVDLMLSDDSSNHWYAAEATQIIYKNGIEQRRVAGTSKLTCLLRDALSDTDHHIRFGSKIVDTVNRPDYSQNLDSIDEDQSLQFYRDYSPPSTIRDSIVTNYGFQFLELSLTLQGSQGMEMRWMVMAVKIEKY